MKYVKWTNNILTLDAGTEVSLKIHPCWGSRLSLKHHTSRRGILRHSVIPDETNLAKCRCICRSAQVGIFVVMHIVNPISESNIHGPYCQWTSVSISIVDNV